MAIKWCTPLVAFTVLNTLIACISYVYFYKSALKLYQIEYSIKNSSLCPIPPPCSTPIPYTSSTSIPCTPCPTSPPCPEPSLCPTCSPCPTSSPCPTIRPSNHIPIESDPQNRAPRTIYDAIIFGHELDWLEIRMHEMNSSVDYFIVVESNITLNGNIKSLYYWDNRDTPRFAPFKNKVIHVFCNGLQIRTSNPYTEDFSNENLSRFCIQNGILDTAKDDDIVLCGDVDEVVRNGYLQRIKWAETVTTPAVITHQFFYYNFHWKFNFLRRGTQVLTVKYVRDPSFSANVRVNGVEVPNEGWHCSSCLTVPDLIKKLKSFSHAGFAQEKYSSEEHLKDCIENGKDFADRTDPPFGTATDTPGDMPAHILNNLDRFGFMVPLSRYPNIAQQALQYLKFTPSQN